MDSHFFYPTASGSLGEARRLGLRETFVKRESEQPSPSSTKEYFELTARTKSAISIAEDHDDGLRADSQETSRSK